MCPQASLPTRFRPVKKRKVARLQPPFRSRHKGRKAELIDQGADRRGILNLESRRDVHIRCVPRSGRCGYCRRWRLSSVRIFAKTQKLFPHSPLGCFVVPAKRFQKLNVRQILGGPHVAVRREGVRVHDQKPNAAGVERDNEFFEVLVHQKTARSRPSSPRSETTPPPSVRPGSSSASCHHGGDRPVPKDCTRNLLAPAHRFIKNPASPPRP